MRKDSVFQAYGTTLLPLRVHILCSRTPSNSDIPRSKAPSSSPTLTLHEFYRRKRKEGPFKKPLKYPKKTSFPAPIPQNREKNES